MTNPYSNTFTPVGATDAFDLTFSMDSDLTAIDVVVTLNGTKVTNFSKTSTTQVTFVAPLPSGTLVVERNTSLARKYTFTPGTRLVAGQVGGELDRLVASALEDAQRSYTAYTTMKANPSSYVAIDATGEHEVLTSVAPAAVYTTWGSPGAIGNVTPSTITGTTVVATTLNVSGTTTLAGALVLSGTQANKDDASFSLGKNPMAGAYKNMFINGDFTYWQKLNNSIGFAPSIANPADGTILADHWKSYNSGTAATITYSRQPHTLGQTLVPDNPKYFLRAVQTVAPGTKNGFLQRIEDVSTYSGKKVNIRLNGARFDASRSLAYTITQCFGTGGSPSANVVVATGTVAMSSTFTGYNIGVDVPSISGKTLGTTENTSYLEVRYEFPLTASFTFECSDLQIEQVSAAGQYTRFERRPKQVEQLLIGRYANKVALNGYFYATGAGAIVSFPVVTPCPMRAVPTNLVEVITGTSTNASALNPALGNQFNEPLCAGEWTGGSFYVTSAGAGNVVLNNYVYYISAEL